MNSSLNFPWPQYESTLQELVAAGVSSQKIADHLAATSGLRVTELMVRGRLRRTGLSSGGGNAGERFWAQWEPRLRELVALDHPVRDICPILTAETGRVVTSKMLVGKLIRIGIKAARAKARRGYTVGAKAGRIERVVTLWKEGLTAGQIEGELRDEYGITRSAVMGIVNRAKVKAGERAVVARSRKPSRTLASTGFVHPGTLPSSNASASPAPARKPPRMDTHAPDESARCSILDLHFNTRCKWIFGDPRTPFEAVYCGSKTCGDGGPYCGHHARKADARFQIKDAA